MLSVYQINCGLSSTIALHKSLEMRSLNSSSGGVFRVHLLVLFPAGCNAT
ncbi:hypothetical protein [Phormidesmis sp. 146-33]